MLSLLWELQLFEKEPQSCVIIPKTFSPKFQLWRTSCSSYAEFSLGVTPVKTKGVTTGMD